MPHLSKKRQHPSIRKRNDPLLLKKVKAVHSTSWETHLRAMERQLPYGITQCYLPPDTSERAPP